MIMELKLFYLFVTVLLSLINNLDAGLSMGRMGKMEVTAVYNCPGSESYANENMSAKLQLREVENGRALFITFTSQYDFDNRITYIAELKRKENGSWNKITDNKGHFCTDTLKYAPKLWERLLLATIPKVDPGCSLKPGNYTIEKFQTDSSAINTPTIFYGNLLVKVILSDKDDKPWLCYIIEGNSQMP